MDIHGRKDGEIGRKWYHGEPRPTKNPDTTGTIPPPNLTDLHGMAANWHRDVHGHRALFRALHPIFNLRISETAADVFVMAHFLYLID